MLQEDFLHYVWKFKLFNTLNLTTSSGEDLKIIDSGQHNTNAGPDFFNAKLHIGETTWVGNVEIHVRSSDWNRHSHNKDRAYDNVILHVVYENDRQISYSSGQELPTIELKPLIDRHLVDNYSSWLSSRDWIPCGGQIESVDKFTLNNWLERLVIERLERKTAAIFKTLAANKNDWDTTFYQYLCQYLGLKVNALPFQLLAKNTPLSIIEKHHKLISIEAVLFGQAGFLDENIQDEYYVKLKDEYRFLSAKFSLRPLEKHLWKLMRLRPSNFPTVRIAQLAGLLAKNSRMFSHILETKELKKIRELFNTEASSYWDNHFTFGKQVGKETRKRMGSFTVNSLLINVVVPFLFSYAKSIQDEQLVERALNMLEEIGPEHNAIIKKWSALGVETKNAKTTQSLLELKNNYCSQKKCLNCQVGNTLLQHAINYDS